MCEKLSKDCCPSLLSMRLHGCVFAWDGFMPVLLQIADIQSNGFGETRLLVLKASAQQPLTAGNPQSGNAHSGRQEAVFGCRCLEVSRQ